MPGFFVANTVMDLVLDNYYNHHFIADSICGLPYTVKRSTLDKFMDDKLFQEDEDVVILTEGVFLNKKKLCEETGKTWFDTVKQAVFTNENDYFDAFKGNFSGAHYIKKTDKWIFYTDTFGMKPLFYYAKDNLWIVSSDINYIVSALKQKGISYHVNESAAYDILTYGFMLSDRTFVEEIQKLSYGSYLSVFDGKLSVQRYYDFQYYDETKQCGCLNDEEIVNEIDRLFLEAVSLEFEKDDEYGYDHIATLSGGLDSRMVVWALHELHKDNVINLTFGESNCIDVQIAKQVARRLGNEMIVKTLDDGGMLDTYRQIIRMNAGLSLYSGISHSYSALRLINCEKLGLLHTGDVGDAIVGSFLHSSEGKHPGAYSVKLADKISDDWDGVQNIEKFKMITRGFNGVGASKIVCENIIYCISPFLYRDFFEFCIGNIPESKRRDHYIYKKWVLEKHPDAATIPLQRYNNGFMTEGKFHQTLRKIKRIGIGTLCEWALWKVGLKKELSRKIVKSSMNPLDKWYAENDNIRTGMDLYFNDIVKKLNIMSDVSSTLIDDISDLYSKGTVTEKTQVITVLCEIEELLFGREEI